MKIGTIVKVRNNLIDGQKDGQFTFRDYMSKYKGVYAKVIKITKPLPEEHMDEIRLDIDGGKFLWDIAMFSEIK